MFVSLGIGFTQLRIGWRCGACHAGAEVRGQEPAGRHSGTSQVVQQLSKCCPKVAPAAEVRPKPYKVSPSWTTVGLCLGRCLSNSGQPLTKFAQHFLSLCKVWQRLVQHSHTLDNNDETLARLRQFGSNFAKLWPHLAQIGSIRAAIAECVPILGSRGGLAAFVRKLLWQLRSSRGSPG